MPTRLIESAGSLSPYIKHGADPDGDHNDMAGRRRIT